MPNHLKNSGRPQAPRELSPCSQPKAQTSSQPKPIKLGPTPTQPQTQFFLPNLSQRPRRGVHLLRRQPRQTTQPRQTILAAGDWIPGAAPLNQADEGHLPALQQGCPCRRQTRGQLDVFQHQKAGLAPSSKQLRPTATGIEAETWIEGEGSQPRIRTAR